MSPELVHGRLRDRGLHAGLLLALLGAATLPGGCRSDGSPDRPGRVVADDDPHEFVELIMASPARITLHAGDDASARSAARAAFDRMHEVESIISSWQEGSWTSRLVAAAPVEIEVPVELRTALLVGERIHRDSGGAFDLTVGPMMELWRNSRDQGRLPDPRQLGEARSLRDMESIEIGADAVRISRPGVRLDFGGIGKGLAVWCASRVLRSRGFDGFLIDFDGEIRVGEPPPGRGAWRIEIAGIEPASPLVIETSSRSISTSGDLHQFVEIEGRRYGHVMDPAPGLGADTGRLVTVISEEPDGIGDALATAGCLLEESEFERMLREHYPGTSAVVQRRVADRVIISLIADPPVRAPGAP